MHLLVTRLNKGLRIILLVRVFVHMTTNCTKHPQDVGKQYLTVEGSVSPSLGQGTFPKKDETRVGMNIWKEGGPKTIQFEKK